ncbi:hypothetical protein GCM10009639_55610 [Kitasatospora putterlickiae]|uniref:Uncharacterized protein n=1 Tax=Kitasatospora putterlickiae TaxID=221725 RepID=A0ABN1YG85_9ACTN
MVRLRGPRGPGPTTSIAPGVAEGTASRTGVGEEGAMVRDGRRMPDGLVAVGTRR